MTVQDSSGARLFWLIVIAAFFPPLSILIEYGFFTIEMLWSVLLTFLVPFAGFVHAVYVLCQARYTRLARSQYEAIPETVIEDTLVAPLEPTAQPVAQSSQAPVEANPPPYSSMDNKIQR